MSQITAVIGDASSIGSRTFTLAIDPSANNASVPKRRNPQLASARIRTVVAPHTVQDALGGYISADFTIPAEEALRWRPLLRYGSVCWLFDGGTPIFFGYLEQPVWTQSGDCQVTVSGPWSLLGSSRKREAWDIWDQTLLQRGSGSIENKNGQVNVNGDGSMTLSFPNGTVLAASDRCSVTLLLFGETAFGNDDKQFTAFEVDISGQNNLGVNMRFRVIGAANPTAVGDTLWDSGATTGTTAVQGALNLAGTNQSGAWPVTTGYRCLRFELVRITSGITLANDTYVSFDRVRAGTREALFAAGGSTMDSGAVARDVLSISNGVGAGSGSTNTSRQTDLPQEFWPCSAISRGSDSNTLLYLYGLDPRVPLSSAPNSGVGITGFTALEWQSPADILAALAAIDGNHCGFYLPYNGRGGYDVPGFMSSGFVSSDVGSSWLSAPPQLTYQAFSDPQTNPDYTIQTRQGAVVEPNADAQPLDDMLYVNYQTRRGSQQSVVQTDADTRNYAYAQGFRRADDYTIQPAVGDSNLASSLGQQQLVPRRNPLATATITIEKTGATSNAILRQGALITRLASIRPGSAHIVDMNASSNIRKGVITHIEWWGQTLTSNEKVELTLAEPPGRPHKRRAAGHLVNRMQRTRTGILLH